MDNNKDYNLDQTQDDISAIDDDDDQKHANNLLAGISVYIGGNLLPERRKGGSIIHIIGL